MRKFLGALIPILIVAAGICVTYYFAYTDAYVKIPTKIDMSESEYVGNWVEIAAHGIGAGEVVLAENGRALIKEGGAVASVGKWSETEDGAEFVPLVESSKFTRQSFDRKKRLADVSPEELGCAGKCFLVNNGVYFAKKSEELELDTEALDEAMSEIREQVDFLRSEDTWDFSRAEGLKQMWKEFWAGFKELVNGIKDRF